MTAKTAARTTITTLLFIEELRRITIRVSATADFINVIFARHSRTDTTLTVMTRAISVATMAPDTLTVTTPTTELAAVATGMDTGTLAALQTFVKPLQMQVTTRARSRDKK